MIEFLYRLLAFLVTSPESFSPCAYDEGSPLVQKILNEDIVVGILSKNLGCGTNDPPSIFTRLSVFYSWFQNNAGLQPTVSTTVSPSTTQPISTASTTKPTAPTAPCFNCVTASYVVEAS